MAESPKTTGGLLTDPPGPPTEDRGPHGGKVTNSDLGCKCMSICQCAAGDCSRCYCDNNPQCKCN